MINIENVLSEWQKDSVINQSKLDESSVDTAKLHAKYLQWLALSKLQLKKAQMNQKTLLKENGVEAQTKKPKNLLSIS